jgi:hypothetical protein
VNTVVDDFFKKVSDNQNEKAFDLWLACHTQEDIADAVDVPQPTMNRWIGDFTHFDQMTEMGKAAASHATDFDPPLYNIWKQQDK